jgi:hypothetical protein
MEGYEVANVRQELAELRPESELKIEYELLYASEAPRAGVFAFDLMYLDREVRRTARLARDDRLDEPFYVRRNTRPLPIAAGLRVREGGRGSFRFLLDIPAGLYYLVLSQPVDFAIRLFELTQLYSWSTSHLLRIRRGESLTTIQLPVPAEEGTYGPDANDLEGQEAEEPSAGQLEDLAEAGPPKFERQVPSELLEGAASYEIIQRVEQSDGSRYEFVERVSRD